MSAPRLKATWALAVAREDAERARQRARWAATWDSDLVAHYEPTRSAIPTTASRRTRT